MSDPDFVYTTYIKTTPQKVWDAIVTPEFCGQYWGNVLVSDWKKGSKWQSYVDASRKAINMVGEVLEAEPPKRLVISWAAPDSKTPPADRSRVTFEIDTVGDMVRLNVVHGRLTSAEQRAGISAGWPRVLSSLKSFLETGKALDTWAGIVKTCAAEPVAETH